MFRSLLLCICALWIPCISVFAGPQLDELVNPMLLDQRPGRPNLKRWVDVEPGKPIGQTFVAGAHAKRLCRIAIGCAWWNKDWTDGEELILTLWDSPKKQTKIASYAMPYKWRRWEGSVMMFPLWVAVRPNSSYYFELTATGGDGIIRGINITDGKYEKGQAYVGGRPQNYSLFFETHVKDDLDPDRDYGRYFALWNLDHPGFERVKRFVSEKKWEAASYALVTYYEGARGDLLGRDAALTTRPTNATAEADLVLQMKVPADEEGLADIGPDWNHFAEWPTRGGVGLTRSGIRKPLAAAYRATRDPKYAKCFNDVNFCNFRDQPNPVTAGALPTEGQLRCALDAGIEGGSMWSALSIGARACSNLYFYRAFIDAPEFTKDMRAAYFFNIAEMANVLSRMKGGGNWQTQMQSALMYIAEDFPELAGARSYMLDGAAGLIANLMETVHPDGPLKEATFNYHMLAFNRFTKLIENAGRLGIEVPREAKDRVRNAAEYAAFSVLPDFTLPLWGDSNPVMKPGDILKRAANLFGRDDMLYVATEGKEGRVPNVTSVAFPTGGYFIQRSGWSKDARYLSLHNGHSTSHGHADALGIVVAAYGRHLIIDPGIYIYGTPDSARLTKTISHSTVTVDDRNTVNADGANTGASNARWDYFDGTNAGYQGADRSIRHRRRIMFARPDYWVICDTVSGQGSGKIMSRFVLADPQAQQEGSVISVPNLLIIAAGNVDAKVRPMKSAGSWGTLVDSAVAEIAPKETKLPVSMCTVVAPYPSGPVPKIRVRELAGPAPAVRVTGDGHSDVFIFQSPRQDATYDDGAVRLIGEAAMVRTADGKSYWVSGRNIKELWIDGKRIVGLKQFSDFDAEVKP